MKFLWPGMLFSLLIVPVLVFVYIALQRRRSKLAARYGSLGLVAQAAGKAPGFQRHIPPLIFLIGLIVLLVALARPTAVLSLPRVEGTVILAFDVSGSMAADDFKPTRMDAAKEAAKAFVEHQPPTVQIGVVAFTDSGFGTQAPTTDRTAVLDAIDRLTPQRGTSVGQGIIASLNVLASMGQDTTREYSNLKPTPTPTPLPVPPGSDKAAAIVMISDGENNGAPNPLQAAQTAADRGVRIFTVGVGSTAGAVLHIDGFSVRSRLNEDLLKQIAQITGGGYSKAENQNDLLSIYQNLTPQLQVKAEQTEITAILAGSSILILLIGAFLSFLWFNRLP
jgi:Ca-activated chloride channel family protein